MARGIANKFVKTAAAGSEEELHTLKLDELIAAYNSLADKVDALTAKMDADFADVTNASVDYQSTTDATAAKVAKTATEELHASPSVRGT